MSYGIMEKRNEEITMARLLATTESSVPQQIPPSARATLVRGAVENLRTAACTLAIERLANAYFEPGIFL